MQVLLTTRENNLESYHLLFACEEKWFLTQGNKYRRWRLKFYLLSKSHYRLFYSLATLYQRDTYIHAFRIITTHPLTHWNDLPLSIRNKSSKILFKKACSILTCLRVRVRACVFEF